MSSRASTADALIRALTQQVTTLAQTVNNVAGEIQNTNNNVAALAQQQAQDIATLTAALNPGAAINAAFALSPGMANSDDLIDMTSKRGQSLYDTGIAALDTAFDLSFEKTTVFEAELTTKCNMMGWNSANQGILAFTDADNNDIQLIKEYGRIEAAALATQCDVFINGAKRNERAAQNNNMMAQCLMASLTSDARNCVVAYRSDYERTPAGTTTPTMVAPLLYKTIMRLATLDSAATIKALKAKITNIAEYARECGGDIDLIIGRINTNNTQLLARGVDMKEDAVQPVLEMFATAIPDASFTKYFTQKQDDYWDQTDEMKGISLENLLKMAKTKFDLIKGQSKWGVLSKEAQDIIALQAKLEEVQDANLKLAKKYKEKANAPSNGDQGGETKPIQDKPKGKKKKNKKDTANKKKQKAAESWMKVPPKDGESKSKKVDGKDYKWCIHHMAWGIHSESDCKLGKARAAERNSNTTPATQSNTANQAHVNDFAAYSALMDSLRGSAAFQSDSE